MDKAPDAYRTISEVGEDLDLPQHVLRFWETRFPQIKPLKRGGGRRYYRPDDVELLKGIRHLLYKEGYTIKGVQRILKEQGARAVMAWARPVEIEVEAEPVIHASMPMPVAPPPAYAPPPPPVAPVQAMSPPVQRPVEPPAAPLPLLESLPQEYRQELGEARWEEQPVFEAPNPAPGFNLPRIEMPPLEASAAPQTTSPLVPDEAVMLPNPVPTYPAQVSMFRGGLQRPEPLAEAPPAAASATGSVAFNTSAYTAPVQAPPAQARSLLVQALEELSGARTSLDRILATRLGVSA